MRIAFVTNFCPHYRVKTFETLAKYHEVAYYFFSAGDDWYWQQENGTRTGDFHYEYLTGFHLWRTRVTPTLVWKLLSREYDIYVKCINGRFALPVTFLIARLRRKPFVLWTGVWMRLQTPVHRLLFPIVHYIYRHADAIVVYGEHVKRYLLDEGVAERRIFVAPHAVDNSTYDYRVSDGEKGALREKLAINSDRKVILYLGRLEKEKGLDYLLAAFASLQREDTILLLVGAGSERAHLESLAQEKGVSDRVRFAGHIAPEKAAAYYALAWVFVLPSTTTRSFKEPWGLVVNEAFNQGVPVIATDAVGAVAGGLVINYFNGIVLPERNTGHLAGVLDQILGNSDLHAELSQNAKRTILNWDNELMVTGFRRAIDYVIRKQV